MFPNKQSLFISFIPKSGTDFITNNFLNISKVKLPEDSINTLSNEAKMGFHDFSQKYSSIGMFDSEFINWKFIKKNIKKSCLFKFHASGNFFNRMALIKAGVNKLTVVIRDPGDVTISFYYHIIKSKLVHRNYITNFLYLPQNFMNANKKEQLKFLFRTFYPKAISWIESWIYSQLDEPNIKIQFVYFNEIRENPLETLKEIANFHKVKLLHTDLIKVEETGHFRKGKDNQTLNELSSDEKKLTEKILENRIEDAINYIVEKKLNILKKERRINSKTLFEMLYSFPSQKNIFNNLIDQITKEKKINKEIINQYQNFLTEKKIFYRPQTLLKKLKKFI